MLHETILGKKKKSKQDKLPRWREREREREGRKEFKQKFHKPTSTKVVTIWGLLPRAFNT